MTVDECKSCSRYDSTDNQCNKYNTGIKSIVGCIVDGYERNHGLDSHDLVKMSEKEYDESIDERR